MPEIIAAVTAAFCYLAVLINSGRAMINLQTGFWKTSGCKPDMKLHTRRNKGGGLEVLMAAGLYIIVAIMLIACRGR